MSITKEPVIDRKGVFQGNTLMPKQTMASGSLLVAMVLIFSCTFLCGCKERMPSTDVAEGDRSQDTSVDSSNFLAKVDSILDRVLVIENANSPISIEISRYYQIKRGVTHSFSIRCVDSSLGAEFETLDYGVYEEFIAKPLREYLSTKPKIDFIVLTKGIPIRLSNAPVGFAPGRPSLDSCVAALDYFGRSDCSRAMIVENDLRGTAYVNRFWNSTERFSHGKHGGYLVTRLDGYTLSSAKALVDNSIASDAARPTGVILLDSMALADPVDTSKVPLSPFPPGMQDMETIAEIGWGEWNVDLFAANDYLRTIGLPVEFDRTENFIGDRQWLMGYASWGSNDAKYIAENYKSLRFAPGAIAETAVSTGARTFLPTAGGQSLIADLIESKVTGVKGYCDEPFLLAVASPSVLFDRYTRGWTLAESFYAASRFVGWEDIVIGDPLAAPYAAR
jgi:uncharacterized protein (TIGR03790 family)